MKPDSVFFRSFFLDIYDLHYAYGSETLGKKRLSLPQDVVRPRGIVICMGAYFYHMLKSVKDIFSIFHMQKAKGRVFFYASSKNQKDSLLPIKKRMENALLAGGSVLSSLAVDVRFPLFFAHLISVFYLPVLLFHFHKAHGFRRESFFFDFDTYWLTYGYFIVAWLWLDYLKPLAVVFSNDHGMTTRVVALVAKIKKIPTLYIQHASVADGFPPLMYDYALLEGADALLKYGKSGASSTRVYLIGMPKSDDYYPYINKRQQVSVLGVCLNVRDRVERVEELCKILRQAFPELEIWLRPHPRDKRQREWDCIADSFGLKKSNPSVELSFDYLRKVDAIIAGHSNILLEAVLLNVFPICYELSGAHTDWYGFVEQGLVQYTSEPCEVERLIRELINFKPSIRKRAKVFCTSIDTVYDGHSTLLAVKIIGEIVVKGRVDPSGWNLVQGVPLEAYEPASSLTVQSQIVENVK